MFTSPSAVRRRRSTLGDVRIRPALPTDAEQLEAMHARCSEASLYHRFHAPLPRVPARLVRQLICPPDGWSLLAERDGRSVALACVGALSADEVEVGILVEDRHQRQGIGTRMLHEITGQAAAQGYRSVQLVTQPDNRRVLATVHRAGLLGRVSWVDGLVRVSIPVEPRLADCAQPA